MTPQLQAFIDICTATVAATPTPADCVERLAAPMLDLVGAAESFLEPRHRRSGDDGYSRNLIYAAADDTLSLYALVWRPGQWTPIHDHGSWGVVGVVEGVLEERNFARVDEHRDSNRDDGIDLVRAGVILLSSGAVTTFVPNPDHIHLTGVDESRASVLSLHLYGRQMDDFHIYDVAERARRRVTVAHNKS